MKNLVLIFPALLMMTSCSDLSLHTRSPNSIETNIDLNSNACMDFKNFTIGQIDVSQKITRKEKKAAKIFAKKYPPDHPIDESTKGFNTEGIVVLKDGKVVYEFYNGDADYGGDPEKGLYLRDTPHSLWSASKTVTATLVGRAIYDQVKMSNGESFDVHSKLSDFFPSLRNDGYQDVKIENLLNMSSGFKWNESYEAGLKESTFIPMLYLKDGHKDMLKYSLAQPMSDYGPGKIWNYSGGNSMMLVGALRTIYGEESFKTLPWTLLFKPLEIKGAVFETDEQGNFIGNSYVHLRPLDMAKIGELYLNNGKKDENQLLSPEWISDSQKISPAALNPNTPISYIHEEGVYSSRAFWLNKQIIQTDNKIYGPEFPDSPKDMYFAAGHYGQLIIVLPSQNMVIARTGHDAEYWSRINRFVSKSIACFAGAQNEK